MNSLINKAKKVFTDSLKIRVRGGNGGPGLPNYGGIGGKGGDVYVKASKNVHSLEQVKKRFTKIVVAGNGQDSRRVRLLGEPGEDKIIKVPVGVTVEDSERQILGDLDKDSEKVLVALGGRGGDRGNDNHGFRGQERTVILNFKMISDVVFVGFPNAGKSSLLRAISRAKPKVASYPFTTLRPYLGVVEFGDFRTITMADLPGLVEGAHANIGLGHDFLKHVVRAKLLAFMVDINGVNLGPKYTIRSPLETICILNREIELFDDTILKKPSILLITKMDTVDSSSDQYLFGKLKREIEQFQKDPKSLTVDEAIIPQTIIQFDDIIGISSETNYNLGKFTDSARNVIDKYAEISKLEKDKFTCFQDIQSLETNRLIQ